MPDWRSPRFVGCWIACGVSLLFLSSAPVAAQSADPPSPVALNTIVKKLAGRRPSPEKSAAASPATRFTPSEQSVFIPKLVASLSEEADEKKGMTDLFETAVKTFDEELKKKGMNNDIVPALALYVQTLWTTHAGKAVSDAGSDKMIGQIRAALTGPDIAALSNADKQSLYEYWISMSTLTLMLSQAAENKGADTAAALRASAGESLTKLFGAEPGNIAITAKGLEITGAVASAGAVTPPGGGPKVTYITPPDSRVEQMGKTTILWRPKYDGYTKNEVERYYYAVMPPITTASKPNRDAVFEETWKSLTDNLKVTWKQRTIIHRFYLPSGAVCYVGMGQERHNETFGGYGSCDGAQMTLCLLDFGNYYVPVAQIYSWTDGRDNLSYIQGPFNDLVASVRLPGATKPQPYATMAQIAGTWTQTSGAYNSTNYYYSASGAYAGNVTNVSSSRMTLTLNANGTAKYDFFWYLNGKIQTESWSSTWTFDKGKITLKNPKNGKLDTWTLMYQGKHPKTGERFLVLHHLYSKDKPLNPWNSHSDDSKVFVPLKK